MRFNYLLLIVVLIAAFFRWYGINWDQNFHLHPDERFLTMVGNAMRIPDNPFDYFDQRSSLLNPENVGYNFFVYGTFPIVFNKIVAVIFGNDSYNNFTLQGRFLSGLFDLFVVLFIYKTLLLLEKRYTLHHSVKYWASFFYAISVLPIQLSHFFAVDTFLNFFLFSSFYFLLRFHESYRQHDPLEESTTGVRLWNFLLRFHFEQKRLFLIISALLFGLAIGSKISAIVMLPLIGIVILLTFIQLGNVSIKNPKQLMNPLYLTLISLAIFLLCSYVTLRIADPYMFADPNISNPQLSKTFVANLKSLSAFSGEDVWFPPSVQWIGKPPIIFSLANLAVFGIGLPIFVALLVGIYFVLRQKRTALFITLLWITLIFLYQSTQFVKTSRYFIFLYPYFVIFAGLGFSYMIARLPTVVKGFLLVFLFVWPLAFMSIYTKEHSRVTASRWIHQNLAQNSVILSEHWDDALPLHLPNTPQKTFIMKELPVFDPDTPEKWEKMNTLLGSTDYYILSSNRAWGSIANVPEKYPQMSQFYKDLFVEGLQFQKVREFTSYPSLRYLGIPLDFPDEWSEEAFTVYDHPRVMIFKKE